MHSCKLSAFSGDASGHSHTHGIVEVAVQPQDVRVMQPRLYLNLTPKLRHCIILRYALLEQDLQG